MRPVPRSVAILALSSCLFGCKAMATREVVRSADDYHSYLESTPARVDVPEVQEFLDTTSANLLSCARKIYGDGGDHGDLDLFDNFDVYLVHSVAPNAATPGDDCAQLTTRLFLGADHPEQIVAVLAHELGHIVALHQVSQVQRRMTNSVVAGVVSSVGAGLDAYAASQNPYHIQQDWNAIYLDALAAYKPWRKEDEFEADAIGFEMYRALNLDPALYISLFDLLVAELGDEESESHPRISERVARLETLAGSGSGAKPPVRLSPTRLRELQRLLIWEMTELARFNQLISDERAYAHAVVRDGRDRDHKISCCGPLDYDVELMTEGFLQLWGRRNRPVGQTD